MSEKHTPITGYTPGPWEAQPPYIYKLNSHGQSHRLHITLSSDVTLDDGQLVTPDEYIANALLIASAPDMAETIERQAAQIKALKADQDVVDRWVLLGAETENKRLRGGILLALNDINGIAGNLIDRENAREHLRAALAESEVKK